MKFYIYLLPILTLLFTGYPDDEVIIPDEGPTQGLTAYYPLNGNAVDSIGRNDGEVNGAEATTDRHGDSNGALAFDGHNDLVIIPNAVANNFGPDDDFALSLWAKFGEQRALSRNNNTILEKYDDDGELTDAFPFAIRVFNQDGQLPGTVFARRLAGNDADNCALGSSVHASATAINDEVFHHLVF